MDKDKLIRSVYFSNDGFRSMNATFQDAKAKEPSIKMADVKDWFSKNVAKKGKDIRGFNSYVAPGPYHEFQVDLFFITKNQLPNQEYPMGMICIDVFTKYATVVPLKSNKPKPFGDALLKCFEKMNKQPEVLFSDSEGALFNKDIRDFLDEANIQLIVTTTHSAFAERMIRTFKAMLFKRIEYRQKQLTKRITGKTSDTIQWVDYIEPILKLYNNTVHSSTNKTPIEARKPSNEVDVKINLEMRANRGRKFPELNEGDTVRILRNRKLGDKENVERFRRGRFKVESISTNFEQKIYKLEGEPQEFLRADLVKV